MEQWVGMVFSVLIFLFSQVFFAHMCMLLATKQAPLKWTEDPNAQTYAGKAIAFHLLVIFIQDCKDLITNHVQNSIKHGLQNDDPVIHSHALRRQKALKSWEKTLFALAWSSGNLQKGATYGELMMILSDDSNAPVRHLNHSKDSWTYEMLAKHFFTIGSSATPTASAPIAIHGSFLNALPVAIKYIRSHCSSPERAEAWIIRLLTGMMKTMHIHFVPWKRDTRGARAVQTTSWMIIKQVTGEAATKNPLPQTVEEQNQEMAEEAADKDGSAPWDIPENLHNMGELWNKQVLPSDWNLAHAYLAALRQRAEASYVCETYDYVSQHYDGSYWLHHMGLVWAILFSRVAPFVFHPKDCIIPRSDNAKTVTDAIRKLPWVMGTSKYHRGTTAPKPYVTMVSTAIIGFLDERTGFAKYLSSHSNHQGSLWTDKHGMCLEMLECDGI
jgi:hypothetical protein